MRPFNPFDSQTAEEVRVQQSEMLSKIILANNKFLSKDVDAAKALYLEARRLSLHVGHGVKCLVINEHEDFANWNVINDRLKLLNSNA